MLGPIINMRANLWNLNIALRGVLLPKRQFPGGMFTQWPRSVLSVRASPQNSWYSTRVAGETQCSKRPALELLMSLPVGVSTAPVVALCRKDVETVWQLNTKDEILMLTTCSGWGWRSRRNNEEEKQQLEAAKTRRENLKIRLWSGCVVPHSPITLDGPIYPHRAHNFLIISLASLVGYC